MNPKTIALVGIGVLILVLVAKKASAAADAAPDVSPSPLANRLVNTPEMNAKLRMPALSRPFPGLKLPTKGLGVGHYDLV